MEIYCAGCGKLMHACASCQEKVCVFVDKAKPHVPGIYCCRSCRVAFAQQDLHVLQSTSCKASAVTNQRFQ